MRAVVVREFGGVENASLGDVPKPMPKAGEVLLEVHAASVNFVDLVMMSGSYQFKPPLPFVPGKLPVGIVAAVGDGVTKFKPATTRSRWRRPAALPNSSRCRRASASSCRRRCRSPKPPRWR